MADAMLLEFLLAHIDYKPKSPWIEGDPPTGTWKTYLVRCVESDQGRTFARTAYWHNGWGDIGPLVKVTGYCELPALYP